MFGERDGNGIQFKYRAVDAEAASHHQHPPPPVPPLQRSYFTELASKAGYMAPGIGKIHENAQNATLMRELYHIELEKERIREGIIASEVALRNLVEAEVRTEMMLERRLRCQDRTCNVFNRFSSLPATGTSSEAFQQRAFEPKTDVAILTSEAGQMIDLTTKPEQNAFQSKRKSLTPPREGSTELPLIDVSRKKLKGKWRCETCDVNSTNEQGLLDHFQGKKHKAKEAASQRNCKKIGFGIQHKKAAMDHILGATSDSSNKEQGNKSVVQLLDSEEAGDASLQKAKEGPSEVIILKEQEAGGQQKKKKKRFKLWCEMCQVGAFSKIVMEAHERGKKHVMRLEESRKHKSVPIPLMDGTEPDKDVVYVPQA